MRYRKFGRTGLYVSELCLGTMTFGGSEGVFKVIGGLGQREAEALVGKALDAGINFIDTADVYAAGDSETMVGEALRALGRPRDQLVVATKLHGRTGPGPNEMGQSRGHIFSAVDASLRRLKTDFIDLYQIHGWDRDTPIEETLGALDDLVHAGKVRYIGFCNQPAWHAMKANGYAEAHHLTKFVSAQMYYSIAGRDIEREVVPMALDQGLAILPWSPLAGGLLSGKFDLEAPGPEGARRSTFDFPPVDRPRTVAVLNAMRPIAEAHGVSVARVALAWLLTRPFVTSVIIGAKSAAQLDDNLAASGLTLTPEQVEALDAASALPSEYPAWMVDMQNRGRQPA